MTAFRLFKASLLGLLAAFTIHNAGAQQSGPAKGPALPGVWAKLNDTVDTGCSRAGDKISATLQVEVSLPAHDGAAAVTLPKGTKLTGTVVRSVQQSKQHPHSGLILLFDTAALKDHATVPVHAVIRGLAPSPADEIEKIDVGSGDVTDASMNANKAMGSMADANVSVKGDATTGKGSEQYNSKIQGVLLFGVPDGNGSGIVVAARNGPLHLEKWTRLNIVVTPPAETPTHP